MASHALGIAPLLPVHNLRARRTTETSVMPWREFQPRRFEPTPNGWGEPSMLHMEFSGNKASLLPQKQIGSVHFALKPGLSWSEAEAIAEHLNKVVEAMCVRHLAGGEG
jgi:hypothetical protein